MVTIVVAAVLLTIAIPSFRNLILQNQLTTVTNEWVVAYNTARSEAVKRGAGVVVCGASGNGTGGNDLSNGCANNIGEVRAFQAGTTTVTVVRAAMEIPPDVTLNSSESIRFGPSGVGRSPSGNVPFTGNVVDIQSAELDGENHRCINLISGSTVETKADDQVCP